MSSGYDTYLSEAMSKEFSEHPDLAETVAKVLTKLRKRDPIYEPGLVDAIVQKWERWPINFLDAFGFLTAYAEILAGRWRIARITVGATPFRDKNAEANNEALKSLNPQFGANFWGGHGDHDGHFWWHDHLHLGGYVVRNKKLVDGPTVTMGRRRIALEVGTQTVGKTLAMIREQQAIARWPYGSDCIWVIADCSRRDSVKTDCTYSDEAGWSCAYKRVRLEAP